MARAEPAAKPPPRRPRSRRGWLLAVAAALLALLAARYPARRAAGPPEVTPFAAPSLRALPEFGGAYASALLWGTYRPGLYFGLRARCVAPLLRPLRSPSAPPGGFGRTLLLSAAWLRPLLTLALRCPPSARRRPAAARRMPKSLVAGLMWFDPDGGDAVRHAALPSDGVTTFGWLQHDGRGYGRQRIVDGKLELHISWVRPAPRREAGRVVV
jgi:mannosyl-oligosaccharide glucosidase